MTIPLFAKLVSAFGGNIADASVIEYDVEGGTNTNIQDEVNELISAATISGNTLTLTRRDGGNPINLTLPGSATQLKFASTSTSRVLSYDQSSNFGPAAFVRVTNTNAIIEPPLTTAASQIGTFWIIFNDTSSTLELRAEAIAGRNGRFRNSTLSNGNDQRLLSNGVALIVAEDAAQTGDTFFSWTILYEPNVGLANAGSLTVTHLNNSGATLVPGQGINFSSSGGSRTLNSSPGNAVDGIVSSTATTGQDVEIKILGNITDGIVTDPLYDPGTAIVDRFSPGGGTSIYWSSSQNAITTIRSASLINSASVNRNIGEIISSEYYLTFGGFHNAGVNDATFLNDTPVLIQNFVNKTWGFINSATPGDKVVPVILPVATPGDSVSLVSLTGGLRTQLNVQPASGTQLIVDGISRTSFVITNSFNSNTSVRSGGLRFTLEAPISGSSTQRWIANTTAQDVTNYNYEISVIEYLSNRTDQFTSLTSQINNLGSRPTSTRNSTLVQNISGAVDGTIHQTSGGSVNGDRSWSISVRWLKLE